MIGIRLKITSELMRVSRLLYFVISLIDIGNRAANIRLHERLLLTHANRSL